MTTTYRQATAADLVGMATVYAAAFPDSLRHFFPHSHPPVQAIADALAIVLDAEPEAVWVADVEGTVAGYCMAPAQLSRLPRVAVRNGHCWRFLQRWLRGGYGLGWHALWVLGLDKLHGLRGQRHDRHHAEAHILSLAVHPDFQGLGLGKGLLARGLAYLESQPVDRIRLEVRPENESALTLYEKSGFVTVGRTSDSQGDWLVMLRPGTAGGGQDAHAPRTTTAKETTITDKPARTRRLALSPALPCLLLLLSTWYVWIGMISAAQPVEAKLALMPPPRFGDRVLVFAPHEDDETVGTALYLQRAIAAGAQVYVCLMTAGEGEELGATLLTKHPALSPRAFFRLGQARQQETLRAMQQIGLPKSHVIFLNYPNMGLQRLWSAANWSLQTPWRSPYTRVSTVSFEGSFRVGAPFCGASVLSDVEAVMERVQPTQVFTTHPADTHSDHWPTYCFVKLALEELRAHGASRWSRPCRLYTYLVHRRGWPSPWGYYPELNLMPPASLADLPVNRWLGLSLTPEEVATKNRMILTYRSQLARFDMLLRAFSRSTELYSEVLDIRLTPGDLAVQGVFQEPTADSAIIRKRPYADLSEVDLWTDGETLEIRPHTLAPLTRNVRMEVIVHVVEPETAAIRTLDLEVRPGLAPQFTAATDTAGPSPLTDPALQTSSDGDTATVRVPFSLIGSGRPVLVDVLTKVNQRTVDHSLTRLVYLPTSAASH